jgi:hypothetical protein
MSPDVLWGDIGGTGSARIARRWRRIFPAGYVAGGDFSAADRQRANADARLSSSSAALSPWSLTCVVSGPPQTRCE